jgi:hypothetical protein
VLEVSLQGLGFNKYGSGTAPGSEKYMGKANRLLVQMHYIWGVSHSIQTFQTAIQY